MSSYLSAKAVIERIIGKYQRSHAVVTGFLHNNRTGWQGKTILKIIYILLRNSVYWSHIWGLSVYNYQQFNFSITFANNCHDSFLVISFQYKFCWNAKPSTKSLTVDYNDLFPAMLLRIDKKTVFITLLEIHVFPFTQILATKHMNENIDFKSKKNLMLRYLQFLKIYFHYQSTTNLNWVTLILHW